VSVDLSVEYAGLRLANPLVVASAGITGSKERVLRCAEAGAGAVVLKTCFQEPLHAKSPTPRFTLIRRALGRYSSTTLYSYEQGYEHGLDAYLELIADCKREAGIPVIASIGCLDADHWRQWARAVEEAGADALELNTSCPHGHLVTEQSDRLRELLVEAITAAKSATRIPVIAKQSPQMSDPVVTALTCERAGADGICQFSRFPGLEIDPEAERPIMHQGTAGHGGPWSIHYALYWISLTYPRLAIPISGCGGVVCADDVVKYLLVGANNVQVCSAVIVEGYEVLRRLLSGLTRWMERKGYPDLASFRGRAVGNIKTMAEVDRRRLVVAAIDPDKCNGCGLCRRVCIYWAVTEDGEGRYRVGEACDGCGLCAQLCPAAAIRMVPRD